MPGIVGAEPAVLYIPDEDIELLPSNQGECSGFGGGAHSALGCTGVPMPMVQPAYPDALALRASMSASLSAYDVHIAEERPPEYLAYTMLLASEDPVPRSESYTCSSGGIICAARKRNGIVSVFGPTQYCLVHDVLRASLYGFGRASGLEGVADPLDAMHYVPDYSMGSLEFVDGCSAIVPQNVPGGMGTFPLECTSLDHFGCDSEEQNSHADLLEFYGARVVDVDPPVLTNPQPGDGTMLESLEDLRLDIDVADADPVVGGRWTITSPALADAGFPEGLSKCTNDVCDIGWVDAFPLKPTDSSWDFELSGLPDGLYTATFEASDFHGNVADPVVMVIGVGVVPPPPPGTTSGGSTGDDATDTGSSEEGPASDDGVFTTGVPPVDGSGTSGPPPSGDASGGSDGPGQDEGGLIDPGCLCRSSSGSSGWPAALWGMMVLGAVGRGRRGRR